MYIGRYLMILKYQYKTGKYLFLIAYCLCIIISIGLIIFYNKSGDYGKTIYYVYLDTQLFFSLLNTVPLLVQVYSFLGIQGFEIHYVSSKSKFLFFLVTFIICELLLLIPFSLMRIFIGGEIWKAFIKVLVINYFYFSIIYFTSYLTLGIDVTIGVCLLCMFGSAFAFFYGNGLKMTYINVSSLEWRELLKKQILLICISVLLLLVGFYLNKKRDYDIK